MECELSPVLDPPRGVSFSPFSTLYTLTTAAVTKRTVTQLSFTDDTALLSLLQGMQDGHGAALGDFTEWCDESQLDLNVSKTKEMIADCRRRGHTLGGIQIHGEAAEIVHSYKQLGTIFEDTKVGFKHKERAPATPAAAEAQIFKC